jgi:hypothetical protein
VCSLGHRVTTFCIHLWVVQNDKDMMSMNLPCGCAMIGALESGIWEESLKRLGYETTRGDGGRVLVTGRSR